MIHPKVKGSCIRAAAFIGTILILIITTGCGGGGSGPGPTLNYTGATTPAVISSDNAYNLMTGAYGGGQTTAVFNIFGGVETESSFTCSKPRMLLLSEVLETFLNATLMQPEHSATYAGALITDSETIQGSCGGSVYYDVEIDNIIGDFSGNADFREYCDTAYPDIVLDGITDFSGSFDLLPSPEIDEFTFIFRDLAGSSSQGSFTLNGRLDGSVSATQAVVTTNSVLKEETLGKTYWLEDFTVIAVQGDSYVDISAEGRYYDHDNGYVDVTTQGPFRIYDNDEWPSSGILILTGAPGTAGGNTMARMIVLDADSFQIETDEDGDGSYDDYNSGPLNWTNI